MEKHPYSGNANCFDSLTALYRLATGVPAEKRTKRANLNASSIFTRCVYANRWL